MDEEVVALLNANVDEDNNDNGQDDDCRSVSIVDKSDESSNLDEDEDLSSSVVDDDDADEYAKTCIRVGDAYQVLIPDWIAPMSLKDDYREGVLLWKPTDAVAEETLAEYVKYACDTYHYSIEQALGLLLWHKYNIDLARGDLANFEPTVEPWSQDDTSLFEEAYKMHNKRFFAYNELLPHKNMGALVDYYYSRYKRRSTTYMPMSLRSSAGAFSASAPAPKAAKINAEVKEEKPAKPITLSDNAVQYLPSLINPTNPQQPATNSTSSNGKRAPFARPPRGLHLSLEELATLASLAATSRTSNPPVDPLDAPRAELASSLARLQQQRARCNEYKRQLAGGISTFRQVAPSTPSKQISSPAVEPVWTKNEVSMAAAAFRQYGPNFNIIAEFIKTKTEAQVKFFYQTYRNRYNLDALIADYEAERRNLNFYPSIEEDFLKRKQASNRSFSSAGNGLTETFEPVSM